MLVLRKIELSDLEEYKQWLLPHHKYHLTNGPYYKKRNEEEIGVLIVEIQTKLEAGIDDPQTQRRLISNQHKDIIGEVNWYWKSKETLWMEIGIIIFNPLFHQRGIGYEAMKLWISELFTANPAIVRLGLTTWSGNIPMMKLAQKLKMKQEANIRNARIVNGQYYDSVSYGILREEWKY